MRFTKRPSSPNLTQDDNLPPGTPAWITAELIALTMRTWQPYYATVVSPEDAVKMITAFGGLIGVLSRGPSDETFRGAGAGE